MKTALIQKQIENTLPNLSSFELEEVLDFVKFLYSKKNYKNRSIEAINALCGKYATKMSSSDEFALSKQEEKKREEKKFRRRG